MVQVKSCIVRDVCAIRCDSLDITFENAAGWQQWGPQEDDWIQIYHGGYDTGIMYLNTAMPEDGKYRILATSLPCRARNKKFKSFTGKTIEEIMRTCSMESGMEFSIYGLNGKTVIPYIQRLDEGCAAFLERFLTLEGAVLKCVNGKYVAIGIEYAQKLNVTQTIELAPNQDGVQHVRNSRHKKLTIITPHAAASAEDTEATGNLHMILSGTVPAADAVQAGRWARGKLLHINRKSESLSLDTEFNPGFTAMVRIDITGSTDASGEWVVDEVQHDLIELKTMTTLRRCITSIR